MAVSVHIESLSKRFGATRALDAVDLDIEPGELFFLLGPSGCGKTTLLRCIAGFCLPDGGRIRIGDEDITQMPPYRRDTGMVFQSYALWPHMTVAQNVAFGLEMRKVSASERDQRVAEALALVRMSDRAASRPNQLSGGQQQRVALARALVIRPKCLLLDEPLSNLDAKLRLEMRAEIRRICKQAELTAIYVTHDQKEALSIADRLAILEGGHVRQCGAPLEVYLRPVSRFVAGFIGETNLLDGTVAGAEGNRITVKTGMGAVTGTASAPERVEQGGGVAVSVRPEVIRLGSPPAGAPNVFDGAVHDTVYLGELAQHGVKIEGAPDLKVAEMNPRIVARDGRVEKTKVWFDPEDVVVLTE
ncbi:MAG: ABC transporter ATP-binding protein [Kiritimatiellae bacterium]|nr:ABC transporter ATP-binding protein [Kiritimatiellia bacterium]